MLDLSLRSKKWKKIVVDEAAALFLMNGDPALTYEGACGLVTQLRDWAEEGGAPPQPRFPMR